MRGLLHTTRDLERIYSSTKPHFLRRSAFRRIPSSLFASARWPSELPFDASVRYPLEARIDVEKLFFEQIAWRRAIVALEGTCG
jgi:hypothetical protein